MRKVIGFLEIPSQFAILICNQSPQKKAIILGKTIPSHPATLFVTGFLGNQSQINIPAILQGLIQFVWIWRQPTPNSKLRRESWETNHKQQSRLGWRQPTPNSKVWRVLWGLATSLLKSVTGFVKLAPANPLLKSVTGFVWLAPANPPDKRVTGFVGAIPSNKYYDSILGISNPQIFSCKNRYDPI